jgi:alkanesulfonate monooxygenase SsuD/methylene tetrahydromethanopterin reductase-like flavin-dependent oxidoreductase (luciferase family)
MKVGAMVTSYNQRDWDRLLAEDYSTAPALPDAEIVDATFQLGDMVEPLGYDSIWCAEHYGSAYSMQSNPIQWLTYWAARTERIDVGSAVLVLPWWQPVKLAHEIAMLDLMLRGRKFNVGVGRGVSAHEYANFGIDREESRERFREMIEILRLADSQERTPDYHGQHFDVPAFTVRPQARHKGHLLDGIKSASNTPASMEMAAELGLGQMFVAAETFEQMRASSGRYNAMRAKHGFEPSQPTAMLYLHCSNDPEELAKGRRYAAEQMWAARNHYAVWNTPGFDGVKGYEDYAKVFAALGAEDGVAEGEGQLPESSELVGTPEQIYDKICLLQEVSSLEYLIVHPQHGGKPPEEARASLKLFAEEVLPAVQALPTPLHEHSRGSGGLPAAEPAVWGAIGTTGPGGR